ncbi:Acyl dehydratase [Azotobacter beijerinckii]|uniref:Acyl dehydratase n=1 Tax=Azotobacter beijerinckii TaxID=170623 RepID=A0A1H6UC98_9GAMM|nr:MaoC family dehydratase [Azotobacter beijerinckii]SEI89988.1 Acyl dehydratase [Azotobacter beijerinckii]
MTEKMLFWEDFTPSKSWIYGPRTVKQEEIIAFAREYDPLDFHMDPELARKSPLGVLCASSIHTFGMVQRMMCEAFLLQTFLIAGRSVDNFRMRVPVLPGDTLRMYVEVLRATPHSRKNDCGWVIFQVQASNQDEKVVLEYEMTILIVRRFRST